MIAIAAKTMMTVWSAEADVAPREKQLQIAEDAGVLIVTPSSVARYEIPWDLGDVMDLRLLRGLSETVTAPDGRVQICCPPRWFL